jgi:hypothetical protein
MRTPPDRQSRALEALVIPAARYRAWAERAAGEAERALRLAAAAAVEARLRRLREAV